MTEVLDYSLTEFNFQIFQAKSNVPSDTYNFFMNILSNTLRNEIAECLQKAYKKVSINSATKMLNFNSTNEMNDFANKVINKS